MRSRHQPPDGRNLPLQKFTKNFGGVIESKKFTQSERVAPRAIMCPNISSHKHEQYAGELEAQYHPFNYFTYQLKIFELNWYRSEAIEEGAKGPLAIAHLGVATFEGEGPVVTARDHVKC